MKSAIASPLFALAALLTGCLTGGTGGTTPAPDGTEKIIGPYTVVDGKIITPLRVESYSYCSGNTLETFLDTSRADTVPFELTGSSVTFLGGRKDTLPSGTIVEQVLNAMREGSGSGLEGSWIYRSFQSRLVSGSPTAEELTEMRANDSEMTAFLTLNIVRVRFSGGTLSTFEDIQTAERFLGDWNGKEDFSGDEPDSAKYDVAVIVLGKHTVALKGRKSGETVTLTIDSEGNRTYTSSAADHPEYHYVENPKTCPNDQQPDWYGDFLDANLKPFVAQPKRGAGAEIRSKKGILRHFPPFPLKTP
ncbi:MAG: hypothetical protein JWO30_2405 [Fibrobacteres bacterium]|nr:hypothetical protein [Fibrobacterota bacterium]